MLASFDPLLNKYMKDSVYNTIKLKEEPEEECEEVVEPELENVTVPDTTDNLTLGLLQQILFNNNVVRQRLPSIVKQKYQRPPVDYEKVEAWAIERELIRERNLLEMWFIFLIEHTTESREE